MKENIEFLINDIQRYKQCDYVFLKNPVHFRTGKPLAIKTIQGYKRFEGIN